MKDYQVTAEFRENYIYAHDYWTPFNQAAKLYNLAAAGYTWSDEERKKLSMEGREPIEYNIMRRPLEFFSGYLRDNLHSVVIGPVEGSDQATADQLTELSYYIWDKGKGYTQFLSACDEMFKVGMSLCGIQMDYSKDFINGDITFYKRTYNSFYLDPTFESLDLKDCGFAITRDLINPSYAKQLLPDVDPKLIDDLPKNFRDDKFLSFHPQFTNLSRTRDIIAYDQYYRRTTRKRKFLIDRNTDFFRDITDIDEEEMERLELGMNRIERLKDEQAEDEDMNELPNVYIQEVDRPFVELNVMLNGECVYQGEDGTGITDTYPFTPIIGYFEPSVWLSEKRVQGIASAEYGNQRQFNKRHMKIQDMFDTTISTGYKYLIGSVPDIQDLQQSGQNKLIGVDPMNAPEGLNSVQELRGGDVPNSIIEYANILDQLSLTLANINESVLGSDEGGNTQVSGRLAQVRIAQGLRANRKIFDNIEVAQQMLGSLCMRCLQNKYSPGKIQRILGEEPTAQFYEKEFEQYDAVIKEGVRSKSQKDAYYYELVSLKREGIVDVPQDEIIRALQMSGVDDLQKAIEAQQEKEAEQQKKIDEQERVALELANAKTEEALALSGERRARIQSDLALATERISESEENRASAALDKAKTITEIAKMEDERVLRVLEFVNMLTQQEISDREQIGVKVSAQSEQIEQTSLKEKMQPEPEQQEQEQLQPEQPAQAPQDMGI